jgi:Uncharacterised MFS-type transporter YbfB
MYRETSQEGQEVGWRWCSPTRRSGAHQKATALTRPCAPHQQDAAAYRHRLMASLLWARAGAVADLEGTVARGNLQPCRAWAYGQFVMAFGVALPAVQTTPFSVVVSAICVGGTFMVITMAGMQAARRIAAQRALRLMAAMSAAFATGQLIGPLTLTAAKSAAEAIRLPSLFAAGILFITAVALLPVSRLLDLPLARPPQIPFFRPNVPHDPA